MLKLTWHSPKLATKILTLTAILIAIHVVLGKISVGSDSLFKISLGFIGTALIGYFLGPWLGGLAMVLSDLIANTILTSNGNFFIGFTFSAFISGVIAGSFLHKQELTWSRLALYELCQLVITNLFFTTMWIHILYTAPLKTLLIARLPKEFIFWPIETIALIIIFKALSKHKINLS